MKPHNEHSKLLKTLVALLAAAVAAYIGIIIVCGIDWWDMKDMGAEYETSLVTNILGTTLIVCMYLIIIAFVAIMIYLFIMKKLDATPAPQSKCDSLLQGAAKDHEEEIIAMLTSIAKPSGGKQHINRAPTGQFLRALTELGYMDANITGANLLAWVEQVTGYKDKDEDSAHFFAAYNKPTKNDSKVIGYMQQINQIVGQ